MKNRILYLTATVILSVSFIVFSCKKDDKEKEIVNNETTSSKDNSISQNMFDDVKKVVEETANDEGQTAKSGFFFGTCAAVTIVPAWIDSTSWPKVMTIDFGTTNCLGTDGTNRRGKLVVTLTDRHRNPGSILTVQPQNYFVNDNQVEGTKTITNNGRNAANHLTFTVQVTNGKITFSTGGSTTWNSTRTNEWNAGESTTWHTDGMNGICDDVHLITGSASGVNRNGIAYTVNITSALRKEKCCKWIVSGKLDITPAGLLTRSVDYDPTNTGNCDDIASVTIGGNVFTVNMN